MNCCRRLLFLLLVSSCTIGNAQDNTSFLSDVETELTSADSLSIFNLIDSLLQESDSESSQLAVRLSYNSNVLSTGRTLGINNFGLAPGISYYHKSGFYGDVSGYWSNDFDPSYYLTVASLGYMHDFSKHFSIMAGYDRYFYVVGDENYVPYKNTLSVTPVIEFKPLVLSATYSFYFGEAHVHRIMPALGIMLEKRKLFGIDRIALTPSAFVLLGNEVFTEFEFVAPRTRIEGLLNLKNYNSWFRPVEKNINVFGIMNYAISIPLSVSHKNWSFSFSYTYNVPKALRDEPLTISESSYLSGSLTYFINLKRHKLSL